MRDSGAAKRGRPLAAAAGLAACASVVVAPGESVYRFSTDVPNCGGATADGYRAFAAFTPEVLSACWEEDEQIVVDAGTGPGG